MRCDRRRREPAQHQPAERQDGWPAPTPETSASIYTPEFDLDGTDRYLAGAEWSSLVGAWEGQVRTVVERKARPPVLY